MKAPTSRKAPAAVHRPPDTLSTKSRKALSLGPWVARVRPADEVPPATRPLVKARPGDFPAWPDTRAGSTRAFEIPRRGGFT